ncbi:hypothetical protein YC2023_108040 [Brassica napus]
MSTTGRERHSVLRIFKGRQECTRTPRDVRWFSSCWTLPPAEPFPGWAGCKTEKITLSGIPAGVSGLPNVTVNRHVPVLEFLPDPISKFAHKCYQTGFPRLLGSTNPCASVVHMEPFPSSAFKVLIWIFATTTKICTDGRSTRARALGFAATAAPSYSSRPGSCPDSRVSVQLGTVTRLPVHPTSPVLLTKNGPLGALDSVGWLNKAATPSYLFKNSFPSSSYPEGNFGGNQLLDGSISLSPLYPSQTNDLHVSMLTLEPFAEDQGRSAVHPLLGSCFKTGRMGSPQADALSTQMPRHAVRRVLQTTIKAATSQRAPIRAAFPNKPTRRQRLVVRQGPGTTGFSPSLAPLSRQTCPRPEGLGRNLRSKTRWFTGFCNSHQVSHFAMFFIDERAEISVPRVLLDFTLHHCFRTNTVSGYAYDPTKTEVLGMDECITTESASTVRNWPTESDVSPFSGRSVSKTANNPRRRDPNTSPDHSIGRSDGRCVQRAGT